MSSEQSDGAAGFPPRAPRARLIAPATMLSERFGSCDIRIRNISERGLGARSRTQMPEIGERLIISIAGIGDVSGIVRWVRGDQFGIALDDRLDPGRFDPEPPPPEPGFGLF